MITGLIWAGYGLISIIVARFTYGRLRALAIEDVGLDWTKDPDVAPNVVLYTLLAFLFWPLAIIGAIVVARPPKTQKEMEAKQKKQEEYIKKLEAELRKN